VILQTYLDALVSGLGRRAFVTASGAAKVKSGGYNRCNVAAIAMARNIAPALRTSPVMLKT
jgi:hypothetical protein